MPLRAKIYPIRVHNTISSFFDFIRYPSFRQGLTKRDYWATNTSAQSLLSGAVKLTVEPPMTGSAAALVDEPVRGLNHRAWKLPDAPDRLS